MRVALLTDDWRPTGGVASHVRLVAPALAEAGHDILVVHAGDADDPGPTHERLQVRVVRGATRDHGRRANASAVPAVLDVVRAFSPHVVHIHANSNLLLDDALRAAWPTARTLHSLDVCPSGTKFHGALGRECTYPTGALCLPRQVYLRCTQSRRPAVIFRQYQFVRARNERLRDYPQLLTASSYVRGLAVQEGLADARVAVVPYGVAPAEAAPPARDPVVLFVGRVTHEKGLDLLLDSLTRVAVAWRLQIVGDGIGMRALRRQIAHMGVADRVDCLGWLDGDALDAAYARAAVVAVPSRWPEPFGIVGLEALARGRAVVAFAGGGIPEWLREGDGGWLAPPGDVARMAALLTRALQAPSDTAEVAARGRARVRAEFTVQHHLDRLLPIYQRMAAA